MRRRRVPIPGMVIVAAVIYAVSSRNSPVPALASTSAEETCDDDEGNCDHTREDDEPDDC
jgi:hypothetical protein